MNAYKVTYSLIYPNCNDNLKEVYVRESSFEEAQKRVEQYYKKEFTVVRVKKIELLEVDIIV